MQYGSLADVKQAIDVCRGMGGRFVAALHLARPGNSANCEHVAAEFPEAAGGLGGGFAVAARD